MTTDGTTGNLDSGASRPFEVQFREGPTDYASYVVSALATPVVG